MARRNGRRGSTGGKGRRGADGKRPSRVLVVTNGEVTEKQYCDLLNEEEDRKGRGRQTFRIACKCKPVDPAKLAVYASKIVEKDRKASAKGADGASDPFDAVFVVVDVDNITAENLSSAQSTCNANGMRLVISNPCVEVWLIDHVKVCPPGITTARAAEEHADQLGLTTGNDNKYLVKERLRGLTETAIRNAATHNRKDAAARRTSLQSTDFAPWTDFPELVDRIRTPKV